MSKKRILRFPLACYNFYVILINSFRSWRQLPHHCLALLLVFSVQRMSTSRQLSTIIVMISHPELFEMEQTRTRDWYMSKKLKLRLASPAVAIKDCYATLFLNISILLQIACTIPVMSCEYERSTSTLRWLNNYMQTSMGKSRLSNLALLHIHYVRIFWISTG